MPSAYSNPNYLIPSPRCHPYFYKKERRKQSQLAVKYVRAMLSMLENYRNSQCYIDKCAGYLR